MLRLLHPFTPYVTEALWGYLKEACIAANLQLEEPKTWEDALIIAKWPEGFALEGWEDQIIKDFGIIQTLTTLVRNYKSGKQG